MNSTTWPILVAFAAALILRDSAILETSKGTLLAICFTSFVYQQHMNKPERLGV